MDGLPPHAQGACIRLQDPGHDLAERGFAGTVFADDGVDGTGHDHEVDLVERHGRAEALGDADELDVRLCLGLRLLRQASHSAVNSSTLSCGHEAAVRHRECRVDATDVVAVSASISASMARRPSVRGHTEHVRRTSGHP